MDDNRRFFFAVFGDVEQIKFRGGVVINLNGGNGVFLAVKIFYLNVYFRAVERRFAAGFREFMSGFVKGFFENRRAFHPNFFIFDVAEFFFVFKIRKRQPIPIIFYVEIVKNLFMHF